MKRTLTRFNFFGKKRFLINTCQSSLLLILVFGIGLLGATARAIQKPRITGMFISSNQLDIGLSSTLNGYNYYLQQSTNLLHTQWDSVGAPITGNGSAKTCTVTLADTPVTYYRVNIQDATNVLEQNVDQLVASTLITNGPGVAVLVMDSNQVLLAKGYGYANISNKTPITANSVFDLASVSKQYTAMGIMLLVNQGFLDVTNHLTNYVDDWDDQYGDRPVTVQDLLHHISGLPDYTSDDWEGTDDEFRNLTLEGHLTWLNETDFHRRPGISFEYNNSGYALLALTVQRVSGKPFATFMKTNLFDALEMNHTFVFTNLNQNIPNGVTGYVVENGAAVSTNEPSVISGDGNIFSSITDFTKYISSLRQNSLIPEALKQQSFTNGQFDNGTPIIDDGCGYGYGWSITTNGVNHEGCWAGTSTYVQYNTNNAYSIVILSNDENYDCHALATDILRDL